MTLFDSQFSFKFPWSNYLKCLRLEWDGGGETSTFLSLQGQGRIKANSHEFLWGEKTPKTINPVFVTTRIKQQSLQPELDYNNFSFKLGNSRLSFILVFVLTTLLPPIPFLNFQGTVKYSLLWNDTKIKITHIIACVLHWTLCYWTSVKITTTEAQNW